MLIWECKECGVPCGEGLPYCWDCHTRLFDEIPMTGDQELFDYVTKRLFDPDC